MKKRFLFLVGFCLVFLSGPVKAGVIPFDGVQWLDPSGTIDSANGDYTGAFMDWVQILDQAVTPEGSFEPGAISGEWVANVSTLINQTFSGFTSTYSIEPQTLYNYLDSTGYPADLGAFMASVDMDNEIPVWLQTDMARLYTLSIVTYGLQSAMDDFVYRLYASESGSESEPVPEPGTLLILGGGIAGLLGVRKRRKNRFAN